MSASFQAQRLKRSIFYTGSGFRDANAVTTTGGTKRQQMNLSYDLNGNIKKMGRYSDAATQMDSLIYRYTSNTNRLKHVDDTLTISGAFTTDIDDQSPGNYTYDASGNLLSDTKERIYAIEWDARGKVRKIKKDKVQVDGQFLSDLEYIYNSMGQRIVKIVKPHHKPGASVVLSPQWNWTYTFYQLDVQGNVLATYERKYLPQGGTSYKSEYKLVEQYVYGGSRLGSIEQNLGAYNSNFTASVTVTVTNDDDEYLVPTSGFGSNTYTVNPYGGTYYDYAYKTGQRHYEQVNHLGNVMSTISDRKIPVDRYNFINTGGSYTHVWSPVIGTYVTGTGLLVRKIGTGADGTADGWMAEIETYSDYYPFGMLMPERNGNAANYRYAFNGMEQDPEVKGTGNSYTTEFRQYDPRLGRWLSMDPIIKVWESPYAGFSNNPIYFVDPSGLDPVGGGDEKKQETTNTTPSNTPSAFSLEGMAILAVNQAKEAALMLPEVTYTHKLTFIERMKSGWKKLSNALWEFGQRADRWIDSWKGKCSVKLVVMFWNPRLTRVFCFFEGGSIGNKVHESGLNFKFRCKKERSQNLKCQISW